jgi:hypothetical protein
MALVRKLRRPVRRRRLPALRPGQVVPGRAAAALGAGRVLARRRPALLAAIPTCSPTSAPRRHCTIEDAQPLHRRAWPTSSAVGRRARAAPATRTRGTTCGASAGCRPTSIRSIPAWTIRVSANGCAACSLRAWTRPSAMCCRCRRFAGDSPGPRWASGPWFLRDERMYLLPGDSPMGFRLPLDSQPWVDRADYPYVVETDPFAPRAPLPPGMPATGRTPRRPHGWPGGAPGSSAASGLAGPAARSPRPVRARDATPGRRDRRRCDRCCGARPLGRGCRRRRRAPALRRPHRGSRRAAASLAHESAHWITRTALCVEVRDPARAAHAAARRLRRRRVAPADPRRAVRVHAAAGSGSRTTWRCSPPSKRTAAELERRRSCWKATRRRATRG